MYHHLVGRGAEVVQQVPSRASVDRAVHRVVGNEIESAGRRRSHCALRYRSDAWHPECGWRPSHAPIGGLEQVPRFDACNGHIGVRRTLVKTVNAALPRHWEMALAAVVPRFKRTDGLPFRVDFNRMLRLDLTGQTSAPRELILRPFSSILD